MALLYSTLLTFQVKPNTKFLTCKNPIKNIKIPTKSQKPVAKQNLLCYNSKCRWTPPFSVTKKWQRRQDLRCAGRRHAPYVPPTEGRSGGFPSQPFEPRIAWKRVGWDKPPALVVGCMTNSALPNKQKTAIGRVALAVQSPI